MLQKQGNTEQRSLINHKHKMAYSIGDRVIIHSTTNSYCNSFSYGIDRVATVTSVDSTGIGFKFENGSSCKHSENDNREDGVRTITPCKKVETKKENKFMSNLIEKSRLLVKGEPDKSLIKKGITDSNDALTTDGTALFMDFLYRSQKAAFVADPAVAALLAEKDKE